MRAEARWISRVGVVSLAALFATTIGLRVVHGQAEHVRWDITSLQFNTPSPGVNTVNPGGVAYAFARNPSTLNIKLTGEGTFVAPQSGGPSGAATGGGTWETFNGTTSTGSGTYWVTRLASWEFANYQALVNVDNIPGVAANGNAVLLIQYSDGSQGTLGIGCHGPGAPEGIVEGVIATKDYLTYWDAQAVSPTVNQGRTNFHIQ
jgi:hypothetical protein